MTDPKRSEEELLVLQLRSRGTGDPTHLRHRAADRIEALATENAELKATVKRQRDIIAAGVEESVRGALNSDSSVKPHKGCGDCKHSIWKFNGGRGATLCELLDCEIVAYGLNSPTKRPGKCPLSEDEETPRCEDD